MLSTNNVNAASQLPPLLPLIDPDHFQDIAFYIELAKMGYRQVLLGGTGTEALPAVVRKVREQTDLEVVLYPSAPEAVCTADLIIMPDVMNSAAAHARPFGPSAVATAAAIAASATPFLAVAYFIQSDSTACRYFAASPIRSDAQLVEHCRYAQMVGYRHIAFDYEGPEAVQSATVREIKKAAPDCRLTVSDEVTPEQAAALRQHGVDTVVVPSDLWEEANDPLALAHAYLCRVLH